VWGSVFSSLAPSEMVTFMNVMEAPGVATLISFMLGVGIAAMFRPVCKGPDCLVLRGPPVQEIRGAVYQFGSRCVEFRTKPIECPKSGAVPIVDTVSFADYS
jgi:hypothetical protein